MQNYKEEWYQKKIKNITKNKRCFANVDQKFVRQVWQNIVEAKNIKLTY
jgi:hypothetical protein